MILPEIGKEEKMLVLRSASRLVGAVAGAAMAAAMLLSTAPASADAAFRGWIASFRATAAKSGVSGATYDRAFRGITDIDPEVLEKARYQPEFTAPVWDYFDNRVHENSVE